VQAAGEGVERSRATALWLCGVAFVVLAMIVVGGATRLTGSGLSITQWKPVTGAIPPLTHRAWFAAFRLYQATPQYRLLNSGMTLSQFEFIFWWEWTHRLLGRVLGAVFLVPFLVLLALRRLPPRLVWRCVALFALGGAQGAIGWWMVQSGLEDRTSVAPERLATHLGLALLLFVALIWTGLEAWSGPRRAGDERAAMGWRAASLGFAAGVFIQCLAGALVAGNQAGLVDADWPLMAGRIVPADYWRGSVWTTLAHWPIAVQLHHRLVAYALLAWGLAMAVAAWRSGALDGASRRLAMVVAVLLLAQVSLGIATLVGGVPLSLAMLHQATAALLLAAAAAFAWSARRGNAVI